MIDGGDGSETGATDLFFSLAAVLIVLLSLTSQTLGQSVAKEARPETAGMNALAQIEEIWLVLARGDGIVLHGPGREPLTVDLDAILTSETEDWASKARSPVCVVIEKDAADSAFLLETTLSRAGLRYVQRVRLTGPCKGPRLTEEGLVCDG